MNTLDTKQIKSLFGAALDVEADQLESFLALACNGDDELKKEVQSLLNAYGSAGDFIEPVESGDVDLALPSETNQTDDTHLDRVNSLVLNQQLGDSIDRYQLLEIIGEGGYGVVFRAEQQHPIRRIVALKVIKSNIESESVRMLFETERQTLALMDHPNIAKLLDAGTTTQGRPYFVMELVQGIPVTRYCDEHQLSIRQRVALFITICRAVHHAHQKGIIHRDLKPSNILVAHSDSGSSPKVIDFGVSQLISDSAASDEEQFVVGTPRYMSPEQISSASGALDTRSDVYSLGAVLYEVVCGVAAVPSDDRASFTIAEARQVLSAHPIALPSIRLRQLAENSTTARSLMEIASNRQATKQTLPSIMQIDLDCILMKALHPSRNSRYDSVAALADDLHRFIDRRPVLAVQPGARYLCNRFCARNQIAVSLSALTVIMFLTGLLTISILYAHASRSRDRAIAAEATTADSKAQTVIQLQQSLLLQARAGRQSRLQGQRIGSLDAVKQAAKIMCSTDMTLSLRNEAIASLALPDVEFIEKWDHGAKQAMQFDRKMDRFVISGRDGAVQICRSSDKGVICTFYGAVNENITGVKMSSNGDSVAASFSGGSVALKVWNIGTPVPIFEAKKPSPMAFSNDGKSFVVATTAATLELYSLDLGRQIRSIPIGSDAEIVAFDPSDRNIAVSLKSGGVRICSVEENTDTSIPTQNTEITALAWHPDGQRLAIAGTDRMNCIEIVNVKTKSVQAIMKGHTSEVLGVVFTHDGRFLASGGWDGRVRLWDIFSGMELLSFEGSGDDLQISADDSRISFAYGTNAGIAHYIYKLVEGSECRVMPAIYEDGSIWSTDISPDGKYLAGATKIGVRLWNLKTGEEVGFVSCAGPRTVAFGGDGDALFVSTAGGIERLQLAQLLKNDGQSADPINEGATAALAMSAGRSKIVFGTPDGTLFEGNPDDLNSAKPIGRHARAPRFVAVSPDGMWAASSVRFERGSAFKIWNLKTNTLETELQGSPVLKENGDVAFSCDGKFLVTADHVAYRWYSVGDWKFLHQINRNNSPLAGSTAFSPDGKLAALAGDGNAVWIANPTTGKVLAVLDSPVPHSLYSLRFSPDSSRLVTCGFSIIVWDLTKIRQELSMMNLQW